MAVTMLNLHRFDSNIEAENARKTDTVVDLGPIDISGIRDRIVGIPPEVWEREQANSPNYNQGGVLRQTTHIIFKFSNKINMPFTYFDMPIWSEWEADLQPIMDRAVEHFGYERVVFPRVMFARLPAGCKIGAHSDGGIPRSRPHKLHIPITTNPQTFFLHPPHGRFHLEVGRVYEVDNCRPHAVENDGDTDRIHFIFECMPLDGTRANRIDAPADPAN